MNDWIGRRVALRETLKTVGGRVFKKGAIFHVGNVEPSRRSSHFALVLFSEAGDCIRQVRCGQVKKLKQNQELESGCHAR